MKVQKNKTLAVLRLLALFVVGLAVALVVALSQIDLESVRGNVLNVLRDATGMPVEIDGDVSWKLSLRPRIELNKVRIANADWAKNKNAFSAEKIDVRLNVLSLFRNRPTIQNVRIHDAKINIEKNSAGQYSVSGWGKQDSTESTADTTPGKYPFKDMKFGGVEIKHLQANILGHDYKLTGVNIRKATHRKNREYSGWIKVGKDVLPIIVAFDEYNSDRKIYPVKIALSMGGDAVIANVALEGTSRMPIDFIVKGDLSDVNILGTVIGLDLSMVPALRVNIAGGFDRNKITLRKSSVMANNTEFTVSGSYNWGKPKTTIVADVYSAHVDLSDLFPGLYGRERVRPARELNVFKNVPLFGEWLYNKNVDMRIDLENFVVYRDLNLRDTNVVLKLKDNIARLDVGVNIADGDVAVGADATIDETGMIVADVAVLGTHVSVGELLSQIRRADFLSELPVNIEMYVQTQGRDLSGLMQTITGPVYVYSVAPGYAHSALVTYMYGTDFLTSLRHGIQDLFSSEKKHNQIKISCMALNVKLRDGVFETQNGFAVETNAINMRLAGSLNLGDEEMKLALTTVPVRGLKLSLTGNVVNSVELTGSLAEPNIKISGAAMAGKVASATGLGLLLAPFTGGIGLVAGTGVGLLAGDLLENWLADDNPCDTAMKRGAPVYRDDPEWFNTPMTDLIHSVLTK